MVTQPSTVQSHILFTPIPLSRIYFGIILYFYFYIFQQILGTFRLSTFFNAVTLLIFVFWRVKIFAVKTTKLTK